MQDAALPDPVDFELYERLRATRQKTAKELGVPPYVVCHNRTLSEIAVHRPQTIAELADIHGMGPARIEAYGTLFLSVVRG